MTMDGRPPRNRLPFLILLLLPLFSVLPAYGQEAEIPFFTYDSADQTIRGTSVPNELFHDAGIEMVSGELWGTWIEYIPEQGETIWIGRGWEAGWDESRPAFEEVASFAHPCVTAVSDGRIALTYEKESDGQWDVWLRWVTPEGTVSEPIQISNGPGPDIHHAAVTNLDGGLTIVWQAERDGQFDIAAVEVGESGPSTPVTVSASDRGDWHPSVAAVPGVGIVAVWDGYDGDSFNIYGRVLVRSGNHPVRLISANSRFEGRARVAAGPNGNAWVVWEEGETEWGKPYVTGMIPGQVELDLLARRGPFHRHREIRAVEWDVSGNRIRPIAPGLAMPSIPAAIIRADHLGPVSPVGAFYERSEVASDALGRLWVVYRHYYAHRLGVDYQSHKESGWGVYARAWDGKGWSELVRLDPVQGDGMQRLSVVADGDGFFAAWVSGRTDRRPVRKPIGINVARVSIPQAKPKPRGESPAWASVAEAEPVEYAPPPRPARTIGEGTCELYFGDLHRHTDISLCRVPLDGTMDDAYRWAIDVDGLDFLGITDHTHDQLMGDPLCLLWHRSRKEVTRHRMGERFIPQFAYERSRGDTDHNVVSLRDDILRPHTYPLPEFWKEIDNDTITIPHQPFNPILWKYQDDDLRPLLEIYQGCRDKSMEAIAHLGLNNGYTMGFIASSDHMSMSVSFAAVWAEEPTRESIFRALQKRRTYGATAKILLRVQCRDHWMGELFDAGRSEVIDIETEGTVPLSRVEILADGHVVHEFPCDTVGFAGQFPIELEPGRRYVYVRVTQSDGKQAWSSPLFMKVGE